MKKLRIAMVFSSDPAAAGGVQEHVLYLTRELKQLGHQVDIYGPEGRGLPFTNYYAVGRVVQVPTPNGNWGNVVLPLEGLKFALKMISQGSYDICHIQEPYIPFLSWELWKGLDLPKVASFHTAWNKGSSLNLLNVILPWFKHQFSSNFKGAIFISKVVKKRWKQLCSRRVVQKIIIYGVDHNLFFPKRRGKSGWRQILFMARLVDRKGLHYLLRAMVGMADDFPEWRLVVVGEGKKRKKYERRAKQYGLEGQVEFVGEILGKDRVKYFQEADIFCAPYADEGFGLTILEAMACGCPIVGFRNQAFEETLTDYPGKRLLVRQKDVRGLGQALRRLMNDGEWRRRLGQWGVRKSKQYSWEQVAKETEELYLEVVGKN